VQQEDPACVKEQIVFYHFRIDIYVWTQSNNNLYLPTK
jgi:hypothetical protein